MMRNKALIAALAGMVMAGAATGQAAAQEVTLTLHHLLGPKAPAHSQMLVPWAERIEKASEGRIKIDIYPAMSLGGTPPQLIRQVRDGVVDIIWTVNGYTPGLFPRSEVFELPTVFTNDVAATNLAMRDMFAEDLSADYEGMHVLWNHVHSGQALQTRDKLARSPADTAGMKLRVPGPTGTTVVEALGATPVNMPVPDLPQSLSTGAVDGALIPFEIILPLQLQEVTQYQIEGPDMERFGTTVFQVSMNEDRWNSLPDDLKAIIEENTGPEWLNEVADVWVNSDKRAIGIAVEQGNEHIVLTREEMDAFNAAMAPVVDQWIADHPEFDGAALVEKARAAIAKHSGGS
ncbi:TRAP transporter substrate-binding protein [Acuticoccus yangtzensis]|uniref:TRAP transporter substrate-binding protein n=1 Tax=Acuticoccus yangtzensis TaxID=1443441 RepID=UPI0009497357|nr:TRAP transporter substrate-binding protein [Acuticoccus yangtzensis]ORE95917.1 TRAP dicarboxylate transporter- DctP subunit [Stappia sp. 22II-S9-Z10]